MENVVPTVYVINAIKINIAGISSLFLIITREQFTDNQSLCVYGMIMSPLLTVGSES